MNDVIRNIAGFALCVVVLAAYITLILYFAVRACAVGGCID